MRKYLLHVLIISFVFLLTPTVQVASYAGEEFAEPRPVRWTPFIKIKSLNDIEQAIDEYDDLATLKSHVNTDDPNAYLLTMVCNDGSPEVKVNTGREYLDYVSKGYHPKTNWDMLFQFRFLDNVVVLKKLQEAKPSTVSYISDFSLSEDCLDILPPTLALTLTDDTSLRAAEKKGISWKKFDPSIHITNRENTYEISVVSPEKDTSSDITHVGWGDFNNDSIEDVMLIIHHYVIGGTFRSHYFAIITKTGQDKPIKRIYPDGANARSNLSDAYDSLGKHKESIESYKQAIRINPDSFAAHYNLGLAYGKLDKYEEAIEALKQAIRIVPDYADAHHNLGYKYVLSNDRGSALDQYKILKKLDTKKAKMLLDYIDKHTQP